MCTPDARMLNHSITDVRILSEEVCAQWCEANTHAAFVQSDIRNELFSHSVWNQMFVDSSFFHEETVCSVLELNVNIFITQISTDLLCTCTELKVI